MQQIVDSLKKCIQDANFTATLMISLSIPDICGKLQDQTISSKRYINWFNKYMISKYSKSLTGNDCYALRCAILHEGSQDISKQEKRQILDKFYFTTADGGHLTHFSRCIVGDINYDNKEFLQISVKAFCTDFIEGIEKWEKDVSGNKEVQENIRGMFLIHTPKDSLGGIRFG